MKEGTFWNWSHLGGDEWCSWTFGGFDGFSLSWKGTGGPHGSMRMEEQTVVGNWGEGVLSVAQDLTLIFSEFKFSKVVSLIQLIWPWEVTLCVRRQASGWRVGQEVILLITLWCSQVFLQTEAHPQGEEQNFPARFSVVNGAFFSPSSHCYCVADIL